MQGQSEGRGREARRGRSGELGKTRVVEETRERTGSAGKCGDRDQRWEVARFGVDDQLKKGMD
jgi:hypothetical protein